MIKTRLAGEKVLVVFELPEVVDAGSVSLCGEFNDWSPMAHPLSRTEEGLFRVSVQLAAGRRWRFRYLLDGGRWENDWAADDYVPNMHGGDDSVVDLTDISELPPTPTEPPPAVDRSPGEPSEASEDSSGVVTAPTTVQPPPAAGKKTAPKKTKKATTAKAAAPAKAAPAKKTTPAKEPSAASATPAKRATSAKPAAPAKKTPAGPATKTAAGAQKAVEVDKPKRGRKPSTPAE